ncbi:MAG: glutathione peroxidase [Polyangiales bacterium]|jgi:glutathione peroxidase
MANPLYDIEVETITGEKHALRDFEGKVILVVNTASACGFTPHYEGLQELHKKYESQGLVVLGFPCNQFGKQEPGANEEIANFCTARFDVTFPMHAKIDVNGDGAHPLFQHLKAAAPGLLGSKGVKWNFTKFLVNRAGDKVTRFASATKPEAMTKAIEDLLAS